MLNSAWKKARSRAGLSNVRVHDLKHTFGRRLHAAGVSFEDRQDLLGHRSGRMTTHYSAAELTRLVEAAEMVCTKNGSHPELVVLRGSLKAPPAIDDFVQAKWLAGVPQNLSNIMHGSKRGIARAV